MEIKNIRYLEFRVSSVATMKSYMALSLTGILFSGVSLRGLSHGRAEIPSRYRGKYTLKDQKLLMFKFLLL